MQSCCALLDIFAFRENAYLPFDMDWADWLAGATIVTADWTVDAPGSALVELDNQSLENDLTAARTWVRGLEAGEGHALIAVTITASDGRVDAQMWRFDVCVVP